MRIKDKLLSWYKPRVRIKVPQSYRDVTIKQYHEYTRIVNGENEYVDKIIHIVSVLCNLKYDYVISLPLPIVRSIYADLAFMNERPKAGKFEQRFKLGKLYYSPVSISDVSAGQYLNLKELVKDYDNNLHFVISNFVSQIGKKYKNKTYLSNAEIIYNNMSVELAETLSVFFCQVYERLNLTILDSLNEEAKNQIDSVIQALKITGDGQ